MVKPSNLFQNPFDYFYLYNPRTHLPTNEWIGPLHTIQSGYHLQRPLQSFSGSIHWWVRYGQDRLWARLSTWKKPSLVANCSDNLNMIIKDMTTSGWEKNEPDSCGSWYVCYILQKHWQKMIKKREREMLYNFKKILQQVTWPECLPTARSYLRHHREHAKHNFCPGRSAVTM